MMVRKPALACVAVLFASCLADLEGGDPRLQVRNTWADTIQGVSIGTWRRDFDPPVAPGSSSEIVELPVAGTIDIGLWARRDGRDTLLVVRRIEIGLGDFERIE